MSSCVSGTSTRVGEVPDRAANAALQASLITAVDNSDLALVRQLITQGADVRQECSDLLPRQILNRALSGCAGHEVIEALLEAGADPNAEEHDGRSALNVLLESNYAAGHMQAICRTLMAYSASPEGGSVGEPPLCIASLTTKSSSIPDLLIQAGAKVDAAGSDGRTALICSAWAGETNTMGLLLQSGSDTNIPDEQGRTALMYALVHHPGDIFAHALLRRHGAEEPNDQFRFFLWLASQKPDADRLKQMFRDGVVGIEDRDAFFGKCPLCAAVSAKHLGLARFFTQQGADVNRICGSATPLIRAVINSDVRMVEMLLDAGAQNDLPVAGGVTALSLAARQGNHDLVSLLGQDASRGAAPD